MNFEQIEVEVDEGQELEVEVEDGEKVDCWKKQMPLLDLVLLQFRLEKEQNRKKKKEAKLEQKEGTLDTSCCLALTCPTTTTATSWRSCRVTRGSFVSKLELDLHWILISCMWMRRTHLIASVGSRGSEENLSILPSSLAQAPRVRGWSTEGRGGLAA